MLSGEKVQTLSGWSLWTMKIWSLGCDIQEWSEWERLRDIGTQHGLSGEVPGAQPISHGVPGPLSAIQRAGGEGRAIPPRLFRAPPPLSLPPFKSGPTW